MNDSPKDSRECLPQSLWEAYEAGFAAGVDVEHGRIMAVHQATLPGHEKLTEKFLLDGHTTEGQAAMAVIEAEREVMDKARQANTEAQAAMLMANWESDATLRKDFRTFERYKAFAENKTLTIVGD